MASLEYIVRPFQTKDVTPPKKVFGAPREPKPPVKVEFGEAGAKVFPITLNSHVGFTTVNSTTIRETSRKTELKRVENPEDPDQYVMVRQPKSWSGRNDAEPYDKSKYIFGTGDGVGDGGDGGEGGDGGGGDGGGGGPGGSGGGGNGGGGGGGG